jgi:hypothetical protein
MKTFLLRPVRGEIEYIIASDESMLIFIKTVLKKDVGIKLHEFTDPTFANYCYPEYIQWMINEKLKTGYLLVGHDLGCWLVAKNENVC